MTEDFLSQNREIYRALRIRHTLFPGRKLRWVGDAGLDDQQSFAQVGLLKDESVFRACHDRRVEVYNDRLNRGEPELLFEWVTTVPFEFKQGMVFTHARKTRRVRTGLGGFQLRLPGTHPVRWAWVAHDFEDGHDLILLTHVPLETADEVRAVYSDGRLRGRIEPGYRFDQEVERDVEDLRVQSLERMRRLFVLVLLAAPFVFYLGRTGARASVLGLRQLGGKLGLKSDLDGPYALLRGISAVWQTVSTLTFLANHPFPRSVPTCG